MRSGTEHVIAVSVCLLVLRVGSVSHAAVSEPSAAGASLLHAIGWQTFDNATPGDNNSGISDATPDSNSTFDSTPFGSHAATPGGGVYLTGIIGPGSSIQGRDGFGQSTNNGFLQGPTFGSQTIGSAPFGINVADVTLADGSPGAAINSQGSSGSSWKFRTNGNEELGDFSIKNESDYTFRLERIHYDARAGNANSPLDLELIYLASGDSNLVRADDGSEILDLRVLSAASFAAQPSVQNVSASVAAALFPSTAVRLGPGESASFRFRWTNSATDFAESQIDNLAISGTFQDQDNGFVSIDPATVSGLPGDYNGNGTVDAADYTVWRDAFESGASSLPNQGVDPGVIDEADYNFWVSQFGQSISGSRSSAIPEPSAVVLLATASAPFFATRRRR